uniref:Transmembrane protein n=1 Tax=Trypanosoma vivax (strain Y486) TaxID=1055687 RepID=G0TW90_TRYVY|nr:hypothetical protein TVY486_0600190 [Trypanosoma vivax Y486]
MVKSDTSENVYPPPFFRNPYSILSWGPPFSVLVLVFVACFKCQTFRLIVIRSPLSTWRWMWVLFIYFSLSFLPSLSLTFFFFWWWWGSSRYTTQQTLMFLMYFSFSLLTVDSCAGCFGFVSDATRQYTSCIS